MRIRNKLTAVFLAVALIPMLFIGGIISFDSKKALENQIFRVLEAAADYKVKMISDFISGQIKDLGILQKNNTFKAVLPVLNKFSKDPSNFSFVEAQRELDSQLAVIRKFFNFVDLELLDPDGDVVYVSNPANRSELNKPDDQKEEIARKTRGGAFISEVRRSGRGSYPFVLDIVGPVHGSSNELVGFVRMEVSMEPIYEVLTTAISFKESLEVLLVKKISNNKLMFLSDLRKETSSVLKKTVDFGSKIALPAQHAARGESGSGVSVDYRGEGVLSVWRPIPVLGWGLVAKVDIWEAFAPIRRMETLFGTILLLTLLLVVIMAFVVARSIADPIVKLRHGAEMIGHGKWDHPLDISTKDEFGDLAKAFTGMAKDLKWLMQQQKDFILAEARVEAEKQKTDELRALNQQLRASEQNLIAANQQLSASEQQLKAINQQLSANEQDLRTAKAGLEDKVKERTRELEQARDLLEVKVQERTRELQDKMASLEKMNTLMVDRELRVLELKKEINSLCKELGRPGPYRAA